MLDEASKEQLARRFCIEIGVDPDVVISDTGMLAWEYYSTEVQQQLAWARAFRGTGTLQ